VIVIQLLVNGSLSRARWSYSISIRTEPQQGRTVDGAQPKKKKLQRGVLPRSQLPALPRWYLASSKKVTSEKGGVSITVYSMIGYSYSSVALVPRIDPEISVMIGHVLVRE
jgi:hypothetical protein